MRSGAVKKPDMLRQHKENLYQGLVGKFWRESLKLHSSHRFQTERFKKIFLCALRETFDFILWHDGCEMIEVFMGLLGRKYLPFEPVKLKFQNAHLDLLISDSGNDFLFC